MNCAWICSRLLPLVSGTKRMVKTMLSAQHPENSQKVPALVRRSIRSWKVLVMMKAEPQLVRTQTELANPFTREGKISDITSQGMGPQPREKPVMKKPILASASQDSPAAGSSARGLSTRKSPEELPWVSLDNLK